MLEKFSLEWQLAQVKDQFDRFKIVKIEKTDNMMLIQAKVHCPVYFAFYRNFIIYSGDYGEWQFDTTWGTLVNGKPKISLDFSYLLSKLSNKCKKFYFDSECCEYDLFKWKETFLQECKEDFDDVNKEGTINKTFKEFEEEFEQAFSLIDTENEWTYISSLYTFVDFLADNGYDIDTFSIYNFGNMYDYQLVCQLVMLKKIVEYFEEEEKMEAVQH